MVPRSGCAHAQKAGDALMLVNLNQGCRRSHWSARLLLQEVCLLDLLISSSKCMNDVSRRACADAEYTEEAPSAGLHLPERIVSSSAEPERHVALGGDTGRHVSVGGDASRHVSAGGDSGRHMSSGQRVVSYKKQRRPSSQASAVWPPLQLLKRAADGGSILGVVLDAAFGGVGPLHGWPWH